MHEDFFDRLDKYMRIKGLNDNQVTVQTGIPVGSLGKQRKGSRGLSLESVAKILDTYDELNAEWLITGKGEMLKNEVVDSESVLLNAIRKRDEQIDDLIGILKSELTSKKENVLGEDARCASASGSDLVK